MSSAKMHEHQRDKAKTYFAAQGIDRALLASPASVTWLTGFVAPIEVGPNPFQGGPPMLWFEQGNWVLIVVKGLASAAAAFAKEPGCAVLSYEGYTIQGPLSGRTQLLEAMRSLSRNPASGMALEASSAPNSVAALFKSDATRAIDGWSDLFRTIKSEEELAKLRENFRLTDLGHAAASQAVKPGATEMDVYLAAHASIHRAAGERVPIGNDFVVGSRMNNIGGWPSLKEIRSGDSFIVDISTLRYGYWSDSCRTYYADEPSREQRVMHTVVSRALDAGISLLRPGTVARDVDRAMRAVIADAGFPEYPHHGGHGVGVTGHEAPRIVPYSDEVLEAGMVVMLEPGIYLPGETSVRLENGVLITPSGPELLTNHLGSSPTY